MTTPLTTDQLYTTCDISQFNFNTTEELADMGVIIGQERALGAIHFGLGVEQQGFNVFAIGPAGSGKSTAVREILQHEAEAHPPPNDWCYVNNFDDPAKPRALSLPAGEGKRLSVDIERLIEELSVAIPATFEGEEYRSRAEEIEEKAKFRELQALDDLRHMAKQARIKLVETPTSYAFAPMDENNEGFSPEQFEKLPEAEQHTFQESIAQLHQQLQKLLRQFPHWRKEAKEKLKNLNREFAVYAVGHHIEKLQAQYQKIPVAKVYLEQAEQDMIHHIEDFFPKSEQGGGLFGTLGQSSPLQRYRINLLVDHSGSRHAPIIEENLPNHANLIGRTEHQAWMGALLTDFTLIKPGALHLANGGYLILDARKLLMQAYAWESLKRAMQTREIRIESLERNLGLISTTSLEPEPIPLRVKIILVGDRILYYLLSFYDDEFRDLFKVSADFDDSMPRDGNSNAIYARVIATLARKEGLRPLDKLGVARVIEHSARLSEDAERLSTNLRKLGDLLKEADYLAAQAHRKHIGKEHVQQAIDNQTHRADRVRQRVYEAIRRGTIFVDVTGEAIGQINALSVISLGDFAFGQPSRVTATARIGNGKIVDIERETELGGPIHSKGVMILSSFISSRYARMSRFSLSASIVFEQSYGMVEGDSASLAELCAVLSALAEVPIKQSFAVTGSVNQLGKVQPIGGVNEKIEGFFDVCRILGSTGQSVIIPAANIKDLMLSQDVVDAAGRGEFSIFAVATVDQALELLMGLPSGTRNEAGLFTEGSINALVEDRLKEMSDAVTALAQTEWHGEGKNS